MIDMIEVIAIADDEGLPYEDLEQAWPCALEPAIRERYQQLCENVVAVPSAPGVAVGSWGGQRPSLGDYVTGTEATRGATAAGAC